MLRGAIHPTLEQANRFCKYLGLTDLETEYFMTSVQRERAGTPDLQEYFDCQLSRIRSHASNLAQRIRSETKLVPEDNALFYSSWQYSAIRLATSIPELASLDKLSERFQLSRERVREILDFLLRTGLCKEGEQGRLAMGPQRTHLSANSPLIQRHHSNWRLKAMERHERISERELAFSCPVSISAQDQIKIREKFMQVIEEFYAGVKASQPEEKLCCFNLDWVEI